MYNLTRYYNGNSVIHNINPLCKLICILMFTFLVLMTNNILFLLILTILVVIYIVLSEVPIKLYIDNFKYILPFILFILIINILTSNVHSSIISIMKLVLFILYSSVNIFTTKSNDLTYGLEKLLSPLQIIGINTSSLALTISLAVRFIPTIFKHGHKVYKSQMSRGLSFEGSLKEKIDKLMSLIIPIFNISLKKSDDISNVLDMRLYDSNRKRSKYKLVGFKNIDQNILLIHIFVLILFLVVEVIL
ncbi:MAG: energy-coupling factor transporter transmembrane protein EcfT [Bacilli bacterium]|nr:energy-coupling factor transporter transmembrane protein EcfT [Bacilli bacterium]